MSFLGQYSTTLPDEIVKEILSPVLEVPDKAFANTSLTTNPFAGYELTSSTVLEVCKAWLRVATPLLYETVILRSKAQAQALALALRGNPDLGPFVKKVRIEGGYGSHIVEIFKWCPALNDLWISAALWSNESIAGYAKAFRSINPQRLIVVDDLHEKNSKIRKAMYEGLGEAVLAVWLRLVCLMLDRAQPLVSALLRGKSKIEVLGLRSSLAEASGMVLDFLSMPTLKRILRLTWREKPPFGDIVRNHYDALDYSMRTNRFIYDKVSYVQSFSADMNQEARTPSLDMVPVLDSVNPNWRPLSFPGASNEDRARLLTIIIHHAMLPSDIGTSKVTTSAGRTTLQAFRSGLMQVSKEIRGIAQAVLYDSPVVKPRGIRSLGVSPFVSLIRCLWLRDGVYLSDVASTDLAHLISRCSNLVLFSAVNTFPLATFDNDVSGVASYISTDWDVKFCIPTTTLVTLSKHSADTLQHLHFGVKIEGKHPTKDEVTTIMKAFCQLRRLRSLVLTSSYAARPPRQNGTAMRFQLPSTMMSCLERLVVDMNSVVNISFVEAMARVQLPSLCWLSMTCSSGFHAVASSFLEKHGGKLHYFRSNPALMCLFSPCRNVAQWDSTRIWRAICPEDNGSCLGVLWVRTFYPLFDDRQTYILSSPEDVEALLDTDISCLKRLTVIHVRGLRWPNCQQDIERSSWIVPVETLFEKCGIRITDECGRYWVPRLKPTASRQKQG
ncbi:hypothetical protein BKA70DRAFT_1099048 [Coprinopsis sp. MPI-PUGE-AT-0042]|nr:hypothetical protein BKA70DRAFT_1099048 [Coprinopsis sp. MPI-PUGE-AT-0042]